MLSEPVSTTAIAAPLLFLRLTVYPCCLDIHDEFLPVIRSGHTAAR